MPRSSPVKCVSPHPPRTARIILHLRAGCPPRSRGWSRPAGQSADITAGSLKHLLSIERKIRFVLVWSPGERINSIKAQYMVDAKNVKDISDAGDTTFPPCKTVVAHRGPAIHRNPPVLSPLLRESVVFKIWLRRGATGPFEFKLTGSAKRRRCRTHPKWNIPHQRDPSFFGISLDLSPLPVGDPLHVGEELSPLFQTRGLV